jgi:Arc/MetJ-type ribon-helix-helix transcriptional regulator
MMSQLPHDLQQFVSQQIAVGAYRDEGELVVDAVSRLREAKQRYQQLRREIRVAEAELDRGEGIVLEGDEALERFFDEIAAEAEQELSSKHPPQS